MNLFPSLTESESNSVRDRVRERTRLALGQIENHFIIVLSDSFNFLKGVKKKYDF